MKLCYGYRPKSLEMRSTRLYYAEELENKMLRLIGKSIPIFVLVEDEYIRVNNIGEVSLACRLVASYHKQLCHESSMATIIAKQSDSNAALGPIACARMRVELRLTPACQLTSTLGLPMQCRE